MDNFFNMLLWERLIGYGLAALVLIGFAIAIIILFIIPCIKERKDKRRKRERK